MTMYRCLAATATAALLCAGVGANAGAQSTLRTRFGMLAGVSLSSITNTGVTGLDRVPGVRIESKRRVGFQLGAYFTHRLSNQLSIQPELQFAQKGMRIEFFSAGGSGTPRPSGSIDVRLAYVELPVLLRYDLTRTALRPFLVAGPAIAIRAGCRFGVDSGEGISSDQTCDPDMGNTTPEDDDPLKKFDAGGIIGIGLQGNDAGRTISAQLRYSRGFVTIAKDAGDQRPRNAGISVIFGIGF